MKIRSIHPPALVSSLPACNSMDLTATSTHSSPFDTYHATKSSATTSASNSSDRTVLMKSNGVKNEWCQQSASRITTKTTTTAILTTNTYTHTHTDEESCDTVGNHTRMDSLAQQKPVLVYSGYSYRIAPATTNSAIIPIDRAGSLTSRTDSATNLIWSVRHLA